ncbi:LAMI_0A00782g1_1 [Lachancea mirantina]|uniref:DNA mismatch repair protein MSH3 n=1 Tax=Lachancea mirantina TaxID=1230905 RepID=A0A1G4ILD5_9SACH|nr:LAMI_0A00782g1_1 [Lachancea mirantina]
MPSQPTISKFFKARHQSQKTRIDSLIQQRRSVEKDRQIPKNGFTSVNGLSSISPITKLKDLSYLRKQDATNNGNYETLDENSRNLASIEFASKLDKSLKRKEIDYLRVNDLAEVETTPQGTDVSDLPESGKRRKTDQLTPLDQQVKDLKLANLDKILAVRVGYKYKFFAQDAVVVSGILRIMLINGKRTLDDSHPQDHLYKQLAYCSIPDNRLEIHLKRLLPHNLKIGVVEQTETLALKKNSGTGNKVFQRKVDKVFTKATFSINENFASGEDDSYRRDNAIWSLFSKEDNGILYYFLISVELSSGEVVYDQFSERFDQKSELEKRIAYLRPVEIIHHTEIPFRVLKLMKKNDPTIMFTLIGKEFEKDEILNTLLENSLNLREEFMVLASILDAYLRSYGAEQVLRLKENYTPFSSRFHMVLSPNTLESLEVFKNRTDGKIKGSLLWLMDHTRTPYGFEMLRKWIAKPLTDEGEINRRFDAVQCIKGEITKIFMEGLCNLLKESPDLRRILNRISYGQTSRKEIYFFLKHLDKIACHFRRHLRYLDDSVLAQDGKISQKSHLLSDILNSLNKMLSECQFDHQLNMINVVAVMDKDKEKNKVEFFNLNNYDNAEVIVAKLRDIEGIREKLHNELEEVRRVLKRPNFNYKDEIEYLIEVRNSQVAGLPKSWVKVNSTKLISRFRTPEIQRLVDELDYQKTLLIIINEEEYLRFLSKIRQSYGNLKSIIDNLATFDCILSLAATSMNKDYVRPVLCSDKREISVSNGRNPIIESLDVNYVPNDVHMSEENKITVITGPNMGGKSSYIRQVALIIIMAQIGSFVPAEKAILPTFDSIHTRIGAYDNLLKGESTFKVEMLEMLDILTNSTKDSLLLLDEVGRGTGTIDGISISYGILKYFLDQGIMCPYILFITHYPILGAIKSPLIGNCHMSYLEETRPGEKWPSVVMLYKLVQGPTHSSYGLNVARLAGIPLDIINRAFDISQRMREESEEAANINFFYKVKSIITDTTLDKQQKISCLFNLSTLNDQ